MLRDIRNNYKKSKLEENQLPDKPIDLLKQWVDEAIKQKVNEPTAMIISTSVDHQPDSRVVLLKEIQGEHVIFFTNYESSKGKQIEENNRVAANFFWPELERQVRIKGTVKKTPEKISTDYFNARPRESQLGALASAQSEVIGDRDELEKKYLLLEKKYESKDIPKPENWGGYEIVLFEIEFWQGRPSRLHDRIRYYKQPDGHWIFKRLSP